MNICGTTRLLIPAFLVGLAVATLTGDDRYGWIAAASTIAIIALVSKLRGTGRTCAISPPSPAGTSGEPRDAGPADVASR